MTLRLGFFTDFKWADSVILSGSPDDIQSLSFELGKFVVSSKQELPIHNLASVSNRYPAMLHVRQEKHHSQKSNLMQFTWLCSSLVLPDIHVKLLALTHAGNGHQYFDLQGTDLQLIVSVGEHSDAWWQAHG